MGGRGGRGEKTKHIYAYLRCAHTYTFEEGNKEKGLAKNAHIHIQGLGFRV
jgi:hypothetical protein